MALTDFSITPPANCAAVTLGTFDNDVTCFTDPKDSQVNRIIIRHNSFAGINELFDFTVPATPTLVAAGAILNNSTAGNDTYKWLVGEGGVGEPEETLVEWADDKDVVTKRRYTLEFVVKNTTDITTYDFLRNMQFNFIDYTFWYTDKGGLGYGTYVDTAGIVPLKTTVVFPKGAGRTDINQAIVRIEWESKTDPDRFTSPL